MNWRAMREIPVSMVYAAQSVTSKEVEWRKSLPCSFVPALQTRPVSWPVASDCVSSPLESCKWMLRVPFCADRYRRSIRFRLIVTANVLAARKGKTVEGRIRSWSRASVRAD